MEKKELINYFDECIKNSKYKYIDTNSIYLNSDLWQNENISIYMCLFNIINLNFRIANDYVYTTKYIESKGINSNFLSELIESLEGSNNKNECYYYIKLFNTYIYNQAEIPKELSLFQDYIIKQDFEISFYSVYLCLLFECFYCENNKNIYIKNKNIIEGISKKNIDFIVYDLILNDKNFCAEDDDDEDNDEDDDNEDEEKSEESEDLRKRNETIESFVQYNINIYKKSIIKNLEDKLINNLIDVKSLDEEHLSLYLYFIYKRKKYTNMINNEEKIQEDIEKINIYILLLKTLLEKQKEKYYYLKEKNNIQNYYYILDYLNDILITIDNILLLYKLKNTINKTWIGTIKELNKDKLFFEKTLYNYSCESSVNNNQYQLIMPDFNLVIKDIPHIFNTFDLLKYLFIVDLNTFKNLVSEKIKYNKKHIPLYKNIKKNKGVFYDKNGIRLSEKNKYMEVYQSVINYFIVRFNYFFSSLIIEDKISIGVLKNFIRNSNKTITNSNIELLEDFFQNYFDFQKGIISKSHFSIYILGIEPLLKNFLENNEISCYYVDDKNRYHSKELSYLINDLKFYKLGNEKFNYICSFITNGFMNLKNDQSHNFSLSEENYINMCAFLYISMYMILFYFND